MIVLSQAGIICTYTLKEDQTDPKTVFHYRLPTLAAQQRIYRDLDITKMDKDGEVDFPISPEKLDELLFDCLVKIENCSAPDGTLETIDVAALKTDGMKADVLARMTINHRMELAGEILKKMMLSKDTKKN